MLHWQFLETKAPDEAELLEKTKQAGELESLKAVEDNLSFTPEEEQYLDTLSGMFKDGVPSDDGLDEMQKKDCKHPERQE